MRIRFEVTKADIDEGHPSSSVSCPIARALGRATGKPVEVCTYLVRAGDASTAQVPQTIRDFMYKFDLGRKVHPRRFQIDLDGEL
jgi:hypothetical protein